MSPDQPAWTVIQTRMDGTVNFYRPWTQYKVGFGSVTGEHWLGEKWNHKNRDSMRGHNGMKFSTFDKDQDTWPDNCASTFMGGFWYYTCHSANPNGVYRWGKESTPYAVGVIWHSWKNTYDFSVKSMVMKSHVSHVRSGAQVVLASLLFTVGGDSMSYHNGMKFSTFDKDQDTASHNCASSSMGGFWYNHCHHANPNGVYRWGQEKTPNGVGVSWNSWKTHNYSVKSMVMKVRPVQPE
ncbi:ficolin-2-like [Limanda limanda]|uniref:ficolin-2-like n=1 Tax=Limanda limanda TaxID=27771 RepID=UPI0029C8E02A|nr:ficolin-2-like [Limanda limanda]